MAIENAFQEEIEKLHDRKIRVYLPLLIYAISSPFQSWVKDIF